MTPTKAEALADYLQAAVVTYPRMSEDDPGGYRSHEDQLMDEAAAELRRLSAVEAERDALQRQVQEMALQALADDTQHREVEAARDALLAAIPSPAPVHQPVHGWTDADADAARLALELECILIDTDMPMAVTSRWWESAHEALALHRQRLEDERSKQ